MHDEHETNGIVIGVVSTLEDEANLGRIRVSYPHLGGVESDWARLSSPMAGAQRGVFFRPEVGDEVLVAFEHGDPRRPYVLGSLWSQEDKPPPDDGDQKANNWRFICSRSGHIILLDDTPGKEKIELIDKDGKRRVTIDSASSPPRITVLSEVGDVELKAPKGKITIEAQEISIKATTTKKIKASTPANHKVGTVNNTSAWGWGWGMGGWCF
jgi:uncharacterized protein involved in type VI secretion and phage assembly